MAIIYKTAVKTAGLLLALLTLDRIIKLILLKSSSIIDGDFMFGLIVAPQLNKQLAFSLPLANGMIIIISSVTIFGIFWYLIKVLKQNSHVAFAWGLIIIGAVSNLWDRLALGGVVDYFSLPLLPSLFNLSDLYILSGAILLIINGGRSNQNQNLT